jgi:hypothetical protein
MQNGFKGICLRETNSGQHSCSRLKNERTTVANISGYEMIMVGARYIYYFKS